MSEFVDMTFEVLYNHLVKYVAHCPDRNKKVNWTDCDRCHEETWVSLSGECPFRRGVLSDIATAIQEAIYKA